MLKAVVAATAAVTIAGSTVSYAQRNERVGDTRRAQPATEDIQAFQAAHLAALRAGLVLTADQDKHWPAFEQALRDLQQLRLSRVVEIQDARQGGRAGIIGPAEQIRQRAERLVENGAALTRVAETIEPLYHSLDEAQRRRFAILIRAAVSADWQGRIDQPDEPRLQWRRKDAAVSDSPDALPLIAAHKTFGGDLFAHAFVSKTTDGFLVGRVFGATSSSGDLAVGEWITVSGKSPFVGKALAGPALEQGIAPMDSRAFGNKRLAPEGASFGRKITIGQPTAFGPKVTLFEEFL
jgi:hypothetical protein